MTKISGFQLLIIALLGGAIGLAGCTSTTTNTTTTNKNTGVTNTTTTTTANINHSANETEKKETASTEDKIGVAECDEYVEKYEACINSNVPEAQRAMLKTQFQQQRESFKKAAATIQGKATLATTCQQAMNVAKQSTAAFSCTW